MTTAMAAWTTRTHTGAEGAWHHRPTGPTGAHARGKWSGKDDHSFGTSRTAGTVHAVVTERVIMPGDEGAGEEDDRHDENSAGNDHYPGRSLIKTRRLRYARRRRRRRRRAGGRRLELGLGCLSHPLIMPTGAPAIKHRAQESRMSYQTDALAPPTPNRAGCLSS
jgi:hypothetical protein